MFTDGFCFCLRKDVKHEIFLNRILWYVRFALPVKSKQEGGEEMIFALTVSAVSVNCLLEGAVCAIALFCSGKKPSKRLLR